MGPVRLDLHVHSCHSPDSNLTLESIVAGLTPAGLNGFALTDHNTVSGHEELLALQQRFPQFVLVPGVEVSTREGHLLAYGVAEAPPRERPVVETVEWVRQHGGLSVLSHPFRFSHGVGRAVVETVHVDAIEVVNGHNSPGANRNAAEVATRRRLATTGGSDVHALSDLGRAYTDFPGGTVDVAAALQHLREGEATGGGRSLTALGRVSYELRTWGMRLRRGFRPI